MLKLKKIQMMGFKSFCDRTEITLPGTGVAVVVGPNGCGKSNILDAVSWVLGEQSAKSLRGAKMEDVIFAGTRERKPLGMAEVSLTLIDPEAYTDGPLLDPPGAGEDPAPSAEDWDEEQLRAERNSETEELIAEAQPGAVQECDATDRSAAELSAAAQGETPVVLKVRRRKFQRTPARTGEITIARRLFRTGESEYLLNGKLCRLRDIQDIFMGTGLGPDSYAIIEQERIGQLLSSKPHDRRAIIEEAAGITRFKAKKRLAELRLEQSRQNLARVHDIFEEVTRQMGSLKRQAAKAERYAALREEMRERLRVVLASRIAQMDAGQAALAEEIAALGGRIDSGSQCLNSLEQEYSNGMAQGYQLDARAKEAGERASQAALGLERALSRQSANRERMQELAVRLQSAAAESEQAAQHLHSVSEERDSHREFLDAAAAEAAACRQEAERRDLQAREAVQAVAAAEREFEATRAAAAQLLSRIGNARNQATHAEESLSALERDAERLASEIFSARRDLEALGGERGEASIKFEAVSGQLKGLEADLGELRGQIEAGRSQELEAKRRCDQLRAEIATLSGRRDSLQSLLREHGNSTDTVRKLLNADSLGGGLAPVGTLADFLEVASEYETVVDAFLREELNYIVVKSWDAANEGMRLLKSGVDGRATFLVHPEDAQAKFSFAGVATQIQGPVAGVVRLKDCIRVLDGFGRSLEAILPKLRDGFVTPDAEQARSLSLENPNAFFLAPSGECFHNVTVTGGKPSLGGPLALKGELRNTQRRLAQLEAELEKAEAEAHSVALSLEDLAKRSDEAGEQRRSVEREYANQSAALRQMEAEAARLERRLEDWAGQSSRNKELRAAREAVIEEKQAEIGALEQEHAAAEARIQEMRESMEERRYLRDEAQQQAAAIAAQLAGLEERKRGAEAAFAGIQRMCGDLERRVTQLRQRIAAEEQEREQRAAENEGLSAERERLNQEREQAQQEAAQWSHQAQLLRLQLGELEQKLKDLRAELDEVRETRADRGARAAKLAVELEYLEAACVADLGVEAATLRGRQDLPRMDGDALSAEEAACRELKQRLEAMGPVNMMALEEYKETAERHAFLEAQRTDLVEAIENTQSTIKEIDQITREKFQQAFASINLNFGRTFASFFGGGQAFMRLTDEENSAESGIEIVASPPGKKLQNVLLLSGGEKALAALALLVGIFNYQPSPFCLLDEVDAPLDESNVGRLSEMLKTMAGDTQFLLVTHSKRMMTGADLIYGVTMQEPGVSKVVSVRLRNSGGERLPGEREPLRRAMA